MVEKERVNKRKEKKKRKHTYAGKYNLVLHELKESCLIQGELKQGPL